MAALASVSPKVQYQFSMFSEHWGLHSTRRPIDFSFFHAPLPGLFS
jgi:hypothetical protein